MYDTFQKVNNKGADQTARMHRLVCACVALKPQEAGFLAPRPISTLDPTQGPRFNIRVNFPTNILKFKC